MGKSVAIVGFSQKTFAPVLESKADELWSMNHAYIIKDFPKMTRMFEIHHKYWYLRKEVPKSVAYNEWMNQQHDFPIYMQDVTPEVPSSVKYPLDEIIEDCLTGLVHQDADKNETIRKYFTSTFAYMMGLAVYEKFDRIEVYGVDMENNTEYGYQKPCGEFWIGLALGRGIKVVLQEPCLLCNAVLYGYDTVPYIDVNRLKEILKIYQIRLNEIYQQMTEVGVELTANPDDAELAKRYMTASGWFYLHDGAVSAAAKLIEESDTYISRMYIEIKKPQWVSGLNYWTSRTNIAKTEYHVKRENGVVDEELWKAYLAARANMYRNLGAVQLHQQLMWTIDMRQVDYRLHMEIVESDEEFKFRVPVTV